MDNSDIFHKIAKNDRKSGFIPEIAKNTGHSGQISNKQLEIEENSATLKKITRNYRQFCYNPNK